MFPFNVIYMILNSIFGKFTPVVFAVFLFLFVFGICIIIKEYKDYKNGSYYRETRLPYLLVKFNLGRNGEYLTYHKLETYENNGAKFLFNVYIPKENGETTEIDVMMICTKGIFVFESKNVSGWIFGSESQFMWYQTLLNDNKRISKNQFYNPIMQNRTHIKHLRNFLNVSEAFPIHSVVVFSERCTLKNVQVASPDVCVVKRDELVYAIKDILLQAHSQALSPDAIDQIYEKLYPYSKIDDIAKLKHIANINKRKTSIDSHTHSNQTYHTPAIPKATNNSPDLSNSANNAVPSSEIINCIPATKEDICPQCGAHLVLRTARKGVNAGKQFYGCSAFPECRYTKNIE